MDPYIYKIRKIQKIVDGDTLDVEIDLGFSIIIEKRIRLAGLDAPELHTTDSNEKALGLKAKEWLKGHLEGPGEILIRTELSAEKYGRILGKLYINDICLNDQMISEGLCWKYDGGQKNKNLEDLK
jgi:micrococcal nuclease